MARLDRSLLENLTTAVLVLDEDLRMRYVNQAAEAMLQVSRSRHLNVPVTELFHESDEFAASLEGAMSLGQSFTKREAELILCTGAGARILVDITVTPMLEGPEALLLEFQALDRLRRISREAALQNIHDTTRELVRALAHEVKNPLGGIRGAAQLLERALPNQGIEDYTSVIIAETDRLRLLVDRMLGSGKARCVVPVNIHEVLEHVLVLVTAESPGAVDIDRTYDPSLPEFGGDQDQLIQAFLNIVRNAFQAMSGQEDARLSLTTQCIRHHTIGEVRHRLVLGVDIVDNGPGIAPEVGDRLFYPMISSRAEGSGLGLSIAQTIVQQHGGLIECESEPGRTRFTAYIPLGAQP